MLSFLLFLIRLFFRIDVFDIQKGFSALKDIDEALKRQASLSVLQDLSSKFYTYIPHDVGMQRLPTINNKAALDQKIRMMEELSEVEIATKLMSSGKGQQL